MSIQEYTHIYSPIKHTDTQTLYLLHTQVNTHTYIHTYIWISLVYVYMSADIDINIYLYIYRGHFHLFVLTHLTAHSRKSQGISENKSENRLQNLSKRKKLA